VVGIALLAVRWPALAVALAGLVAVGFIVLGVVVVRVLIPRARDPSKGRRSREFAAARSVIHTDDLHSTV